MENDTSHLVLEACVETFEQAVRAEQSGAHRIELCADLTVGGVTPAEALIRKCKSSLTIPIMVMIRPRGGNFVFSKMEMEEMKHSIQICKEIGVQGVVIGNLTQENEVDLDTTAELVKAASPLEVTFHKAIDDTRDILKSVELISQLTGIQRILTSGGKSTALEGASTLREMIAIANGRLTILAAGKVAKENLELVHEKVGTMEYHGRRIVF